MNKTKQDSPQKVKPTFIKFTSVQTGYLSEIVARHRKEWLDAVNEVYADVGVLQKILDSPLGKYQLRQDYSGLDVLPEPEKGKK